jgi:hypothetical protein
LIEEFIKYNQVNYPYCDVRYLDLYFFAWFLNLIFVYCWWIVFHCFTSWLLGCLIRYVHTFFDLYVGVFFSVKNMLKNFVYSFFYYVLMFRIWCLFLWLFFYFFPWIFYESFIVFSFTLLSNFIVHFFFVFVLFIFVLLLMFLFFSI